MSLRLLHVVTAPRAEGTPRLVLDWVKTNMHDQQVFFLNSKPDELLEDFNEASNQITVNNKPLLKGFFKVFQIIYLTYKICRKTRPDLVISWNTGFSAWVHLGAFLAKRPKLITHCGNAPGSTFMSKYFYPTLIFGINKILGAKMVCCSNYIRNSYISIKTLPRKSFYSIYNCINTASFQLLEHEFSKSAVMVATFENHKDHKTLIDAWVEIEKEIPDASLTFIGNGSLKPHYESYVKQLGLKNITFLGSRKDIAELLPTFDVFILSTTKYEGFGTVLIEALASGLPIIASNVAACREVLQEGKYGKLTKAGDATSLASALMETFNRKMEFLSPSERIAYAKQFSAENMIHNYVNLFYHE